MKFFVVLGALLVQAVLSETTATCDQVSSGRTQQPQIQGGFRGQNTQNNQNNQNYQKTQNYQRPSFSGNGNADSTGSQGFNGQRPERQGGNSGSQQSWSGNQRPIRGGVEAVATDCWKQWYE